MKYSLTLSRWHKVAERLNAGSKERETRALAALTATTVSPWNKEGVEAKAAEIAERAKADLAVIEAATAAVARIRTALSLRNVELGVSERLAEADAVSRRSRLYRELRDKQGVDMVKPADMRHVPATVAADEPYSFSRRARTRCSTRSQMRTGRNSNWSWTRNCPKLRGSPPDRGGPPPCCRARGRRGESSGSASGRGGANKRDPLAGTSLVHHMDFAGQEQVKVACLAGSEKVAGGSAAG